MTRCQKCLNEILDYVVNRSVIIGIEANQIQNFMRNKIEVIFKKTCKKKDKRKWKKFL
jgi:hypothetical protein